MTQVHTCAEVTSAHTAVRVQFYPTPDGATVEWTMSTRTHPATNGGFANGAAPWAPYPNTNSNFVVYPSGATTAHSGSHFAATNTAGAGGGIYEDVPLNTTPGETICGSAG